MPFLTSNQQIHSSKGKSNEKLSYRRETRATRFVSWNNWPTLERITQTDRVSAWEAVSPTVAFYPLPAYFCTCIIQLSPSQHAMPWVSSTYSRTTNLVDVNWTVTVIIIFDYYQSCWQHRVFLRQRTIMDADELSLLVAWLSGRTSVFGRRTYSVLRSTCSWRVTTYVGKPSAMGQPTRPTQPFILSGSIDE